MIEQSELSVDRERSDNFFSDPIQTAEILRKICDAAPIGLFFTDMDGNDIYVNESNLNQMGLTFDEALGKGWQSAIHPGDRERVFTDFQKAVTSGQVYRGTNRYLRPDGTVIEALVRMASVDDASGPVGFVGVAEDITLEAQRRVQQAQEDRLSSIGRLAGGVAHDFNNLLTVILGYAELMELGLTEQELATAEIRQAALRARQMTDQLLSFARRQITEPAVVDVAAAIRSIQSTLRRLVPSSIELSLLFGDDEAWPVLIDPSQFDQLIMNLCVNARDAITGSGRISIELTNTVEKKGSRLEDLDPGEYVEIVVSDTGVGMSEETIARVFEPFYTTKGEGGSGLGLATCYGIVRQCGGRIWVYSEPGFGSAFKVLLPRSSRKVALPTPSCPTADNFEGAETVLVIEDEPTLRALIQPALERLGYEVFVAANGREGLRIASELSSIDLIVSDIVMPVMTGPAAVAQIRTIHPDTRVLYTSGYTEEFVVKDGVVEPGVAFLAKPYTPLELARRIRSMLGIPS